MGAEFRYPNIPNGTAAELRAYMKSYLYQLVEQLQFATTNAGLVSGYAASQQQASAAKQPASDSIDPVASFNSIKPLIIKSADIVNAYYTAISNRLEGLYIAESDFGTYVEETELVLNQSSNDIEQLYSNMQSILTDIENLGFTLAEVNAYIKSGLLDDGDDGIPVYGLEIGQKNTVDGEEVFNKYARFTSGGLTFYDQNDSEVAYISDYKLYIRNAEITVSLRMGGFVDTVLANGDVVTKWAGGEALQWRLVR